GPSAGGLMTASFVSGVLGQEMKSDVAFTGTINPDASIGPVGGIQYKLEAVAKEGKKTFLIPIGQRYEVDEDTGQTVDVINKGQLAGLKVQEVATLDEAYEILTGKTLPRTVIPSRAPDLSPDAYDRMRPKVLDWKADYTEAMGRFKTVDPLVQRLLADSAAQVDATSKQSDKAMTEGSVAAAYGKIQEATAGANALAIGARAIEVLLQTEDFNAASNLTYFDALVLDQIAADAGMRTDQLKNTFAASNLDYVVATYGASPAALDYLEKNIGKATPALGYAQLGFAVSSYLSSSQLVATH